MRTRVVVVGLVLLVIASVLLFEGNKMLTALDACSLLRVCSPDMNPDSPAFSSSVATAQTEVALGVLFALAGTSALVLGLTLKEGRPGGDDRSFTKEERQRDGFAEKKTDRLYLGAMLNLWSLQVGYHIVGLAFGQAHVRYPDEATVRPQLFQV